MKRKRSTHQQIKLKFLNAFPPQLTLLSFSYVSLHNKKNFLKCLAKNLECANCSYAHFETNRVHLEMNISIFVQI